VTIPRDIVYVWCVFRCEKTKRVAGANEHDVLAVPMALGMYLFCIWVGVNLQGMLLAGDRVLGLLEDTLRLLLFLDHVLQAGAEIHIPGTRSSNSFKQWIRRTTRQGGTVEETKGSSGESRLAGSSRRPNRGTATQHHIATSRSSGPTCRRLLLQGVGKIKFLPLQTVSSLFIYSDVCEDKLRAVFARPAGVAWYGI